MKTKTRKRAPWLTAMLIPSLGLPGTGCQADLERPADASDRIVDFAVSGPTIVLGLQDGRLFRSDNAGGSWIETAGVPANNRAIYLARLAKGKADEWWVQYRHTNQAIKWKSPMLSYVWSFGLAVSLDNGINFENIDADSIETAAMFGNYGEDPMLLDSAGQIWRATTGTTGLPMSGIVPIGRPIPSGQAGPAAWCGGSIFVAVGQELDAGRTELQTLWRSDDLGQTWNELMRIPSLDAIEELACSGTGDLWAVTGRFDVHRYVVDPIESTWQYVASLEDVGNPRFLGVASIAATADTVFLGLTAGCIVQVFLNSSSELPALPYRDDEYNDTVLRVDATGQLWAASAGVLFRMDEGAATWRILWSGPSVSADSRHPE